MIKKYNNLSLAYGIPGFVLEIAGRGMWNSRDDAVVGLGVFIWFIGIALFMTGLAYYAKAKGRSRAWCLMAFFSCLGLIVLACLKDMAEEPKISQEELNKFD
jgi:uncharacterized membrane protein YhaH (DUF805 family)